MIKRLLITLALIILMFALVIPNSMPIVILGFSIPITALIFIAAGILLLTLVLPILMGGC